MTFLISIIPFLSFTTGVILTLYIGKAAFVALVIFAIGQMLYHRLRAK